MCWKIFEYSVSEEVIVDAPCDTVWEIVVDLDNHEKYLPFLESTERCVDGWLPTRYDDGEKSRPALQVGTKLRRKVVVGERVIFSNVTVTALDDSKTNTWPKSVAVFADNFAERLTGRVCWTVSPAAEGQANDNSRCLLQVTSTILPKRLWLSVGGKFGALVCCFSALTTKNLRSDLEGFAVAAEARKGKG